jgi:hypothetical protein
MEETNAVTEKKISKPRRINQEEFYYRNLILGELSADLIQEKLKQELSGIGAINKLELYVEPKLQKPLYAIAEFENRADCEKAYQYFMEKPEGTERTYYGILGCNHKDLVDFHRGFITHPEFPALDFSKPENFLPLMRKVQRTSRSVITTSSSNYDPYVPEKVNNRWLRKHSGSWRTCFGYFWCFMAQPGYRRCMGFYRGKNGSADQ